jgi:hypothetical protein
MGGLTIFRRLTDLMNSMGKGMVDARLGARREEFDVEELRDEEDRPDKNAA